MVKRPLLAVVVWLAAAGSSFALSNSAIKSYNQGVEHLNNKNYQAAVPFFDSAISNAKDFAEAYYARAVCKHALKDSQGALSDLNQLLELKPGNIDGYALRAIIWYEQEEWEPAQRDFTKVLQQRPNDAQALLGRGIVALKQEHMNIAQRDLSRYVKLRPNDPMAPEIRELLASLKGEEEPEQKSPDQVYGSRPVSQKTRELTDKLLIKSPGVSQAYQDRWLRGQQSNVKGDIEKGQVEIISPQ